MRKTIHRTGRKRATHKKKAMHPTHHTHKLENKDNGATVYKVRHRLTRESKLAIGGSTLLVATMLFGAGLKLGDISAQRQANAGGTDTLGVSVSELDSADETWVIPSSLTGLPETSLFSIEDLIVGGTSALIAWNPATDEASSRSPFPRDGIYRITYTKTPEDGSSWQAVAASPLGTGQQIRFVSAKGNNPAHWEAVGYDYMNNGTNILPADAQLGDTYYYRAELQQTNGDWSPIDSAVAKLTVPKVTLSLAGTPEYLAGNTWTNDTKAAQFGEVNPTLAIEWRGNADDNFSAPHTYLYASASPTMDNKQLAKSLVTSGSQYAVAQEPASTRYYAVYDGEDHLLSAVFEVKTSAR